MASGSPEEVTIFSWDGAAALQGKAEQVGNRQSGEKAKAKAWCHQGGE